MRRALAFYVGHVERNTIEYWQRRIFYIITFFGLAAGTICIIPVCVWLAATGKALGLFLVLPFLVNTTVILAPSLSIKSKTLVIAANFYLIGVISFILAGPEGEGGIWFTVSVLIMSLFIGLRASLLAGCLNFATEMAFAVLHAKGLISWHVLRDFRFLSWVIQAGNIFLFTATFAIANAMLIRGVDGSFKFLRSAEARTRALLAEQAILKDELKSRLSEKEVLLRELHHRVKNNLAMISSLIRLSTTGIEDARALSAFEASYRRIDSLALLHEELYCSDNLADLDFGPFLENIVQRIVSSVAAPSGLSLLVEADHLFLPMATAVPLALIVNELVTNSLKYAFPGRDHGSIRVRLSENAAEAALTVSDDGVGLPASMRPERSTSIGLVLVHQLAQQIEASVEYRGGAGTVFEVRFSLPTI
jgi:two-component sensor histidine kinase